MTDVSVIVNLHREGRICEATFESVLAAARLAKDHGISLEIISIIDNGDADTLDAVGRYDKFIKIHECRLGDLSQARNFGVSVSSGRFVTFIDGDDLWGTEWLVRCLDTISKYSNEKVIIHPQLNLYFGKNTKSNFWVHADMIADKTDLVDIFISNRWTALCFAGREVFENFPYVRN